MRLSVLSSLLSLALVVGLIGCSGSQRVTHNSPKQAYEKGMEQFEKENYDRALRYFRGVLSYGRGNEWGPDAQFQLAMTQRKKGKYLVAANEFKRFTQLYRNNQKVPRAEYERARAYSSRSPDYQLTQTDSRKAIDLFQLFIERYPDHELVPDAQAKIDKLRAKLAHKQFAAGKLYERRDMWRAATRSYEDVFDTYPDTPWADNALLGALRTYVRYADRSVQEKRAERYQKAIDQYGRLTQLFPDSPLLKQAQPLRDEAQRKLERVRKQAENQQSLARDGTSNP
ncbi:MAG: outer membrane protein assembly factor BamD [Bacteroidetes bacterium QH_7_62_13]|nr:MAG: outer membrane protein assembly factor BamD [Bacteroidetes bacterium QH_7_62_13]